MAKVRREWPTGQTSEFYKLVPKELKANLAFRRRILEWANTAERQEELRIICARDILFYVNVFGYTLNPKDHPKCADRAFITYPFQDEAILSLVSAIGERDIAVPKSRDMGASWMCLVVLEWFWHFRPRQQFLLTSKQESLVDGDSEKSLFSKLDYWWSQLPSWLQPRRKRTSMSCRNLDTDSHFSGQATVPTIGVGDRLTAVLLDESAEMPFAAASDDGYHELPNLQQHSERALRHGQRIL